MNQVKKKTRKAAEWRGKAETHRRDKTGGGRRRGRGEEKAERGRQEQKLPRSLAEALGEHEVFE